MNVHLKRSDQGSQKTGRGTAGPCGERRRYHALLAQATQRLAAGSRKEAWAIARWIATPGRAWPTSFESICTTLGYDADMLRAQLLWVLADRSPRDAR